MAFINYTIVPEDKVVVIDGKVANNVSMTGIPENVHAIQWYGVREQGTIEYDVDPVTGELPAPGSFTNPDDYSAQTTEAEAIIYAQENPVTYYSINPSTLGQPIVVTTPGWPQPSNTTTLVPPAVTEGNSLYWYQDSWYVWTFDPSLPLPEAKSVMVNTTNTTAYNILFPTDWMVVRQSENGTPIPAEWDSWRQTIRSEAAQKKVEIESCESTESLNEYCESAAYKTWSNPPVQGGNEAR